MRIILIKGFYFDWYRKEGVGGKRGEAGNGFHPPCNNNTKKLKKK